MIYIYSTPKHIILSYFAIISRECFASYGFSLVISPSLAGSHCLRVLTLKWRFLRYCVWWKEFFFRHKQADLFINMAIIYAYVQKLANENCLICFLFIHLFIRNKFELHSFWSVRRRNCCKHFLARYNIWPRIRFGAKIVIFVQFIRNCCGCGVPLSFFMHKSNWNENLISMRLCTDDVHSICQMSVYF